MPFRQIRIVPGMVGVRQMPEEMLGLIRFSDHFTEEVCRVFASQEVEDFFLQLQPPIQFLDRPVGISLKQAAPSIGDRGIASKHFLNLPGEPGWS